MYIYFRIINILGTALLIIQTYKDTVEIYLEDINYINRSIRIELLKTNGIYF